MRQPTWDILEGDCRQLLHSLPANSVHCVATSPPYYRLRAYNSEPQVWGSTDPDLFVAHLVEVFQAVRRVLRNDGVLWVNMGDSYAGGGSGQNFVSAEPKGAGGGRLTEPGGFGHVKTSYNPAEIGLKSKNLCLVPFRLALALQADGWIVRSDCLWHKPNGMPSSVEDRPTTTHEYVFMLAKQGAYFYDNLAVRQPYSPATLPQKGAAYHGQGQNLYEEEGVQNPSDTKRRIIESMERLGGANLRSVWSIPTAPFTSASVGVKGTEHFASWPVDLAARMVLLSTSEAGCCETCGAPWRRVVEKERTPRGDCFGRKQIGEFDHGQAGTPYLETTAVTTGWQPTCSCAAPAVPCRVLDPFSGTSATGEAALKHGRDFVGLELNGDYARIGRARLTKASTQPRLDFG